ncbi:MAG: LuxR C-terminal-related transcriptional regulator [Candidatus Eremiobacteraeota bacterium]|nr:LuxR C-terminal-related transcriptional regulator [Candidatus Eremiobacteraeota bacterium]
MDSAHAYSVTVLIAGAGYGKSVALDHWLAQQQETIVRYDVLEGSRGVFDFALGLATVLAPHVKLGQRAILSALGAAEKSAVPDQDLAAWLVNATKKFKGTIVVDDFHTAAADDPAVSKLFARLVERAGSDIRWIVASRAPCGLPITSWIAYGQSQMALAERELTFTHDEATETSRTLGASLSAAQINELYAYTGGWPTAMTFALLSSERTLDLEELRATTQALSYQYLAEQVLLGLGADDIDFLERTSVYDRIDLDVLMQAGITQPRARLQHLKDHGTFMIRTADGGIRYHDLFRDFLRHRLSENDEKFKAAWTDAGGAYERLEQFGRALVAYETALDAHSVRRVLEEKGFNLIEHGQRRIVLHALDGLDVEIDLESHPVILALRANCEANTGDPKRAEAWYRAAIAHASSTVQEAELRLQFARELMSENRTEAAQILEPALRHELPLELKIAIMGYLATNYWFAERHAAALDLIDHALKLSAPLANEEVRAGLLHQSAYLLALSGKSKAACERAMQALSIAQPLHLHSLCARIQSLLYYIESRSDNVGQMIWCSKQMQKSAAQAGDMTLMFSAIIAAYELEVERGNYEVLPQLAEQLRGFDAERYSRARQALLPAFALQAAWQRRFDEATTILAGSEADQQTPARRALRATELALYSAAAGKRAEADLLCLYAQEQLREHDAFEPYSPQRHAKTLLLLGLSTLLLGKVATANRAIAEAEKLTHQLTPRSKALVRAARSMFVHLETRALEKDVDDAFRLLEETGSTGIARMLRALPMPTFEREGTSAILTRTEVEVLRALERCGESKAAAADLGKSPLTIDWHVKSIKKKLAVKTRREAILFARDRGLIG